MENPKVMTLLRLMVLFQTLQEKEELSEKEREQKEAIRREIIKTKGCRIYA